VLVDAWSGDKVRLRAWEPEDWQAEARWSRDSEGQRLDHRVLFPRSDAAIRKQAEDYAQLETKVRRVQVHHREAGR
jgi:hypothetical protein